MNKFNTYLVLIILLLLTAGAAAQQSPTYKIVGNEIVNTKQNNNIKPKQTNLTHTIKGIKYPVFESTNGKYYILRVSKKTNKEYKQYLKL